MLRPSIFRSTKRSSLAVGTMIGLCLVASGQAWAATVGTIYAPPATTTTAPSVPPIGTIYAPPATSALNPISAPPVTTAPSVPPFGTIYAPPASGSLSPAPTTPSAPNPPGVSRVIRFDGPAGSRPSSADWNYEIGGGGWGNGELETYTNSTANSYLDGHGNLVITARRQTLTGPDGITRNFTSARLSTANKVIVEPGSYVEASITAPVGAGVWPAFWTLGTDIAQVNWPRCGEIDILEVTGATPTLAKANLHMSRLSNPAQNNQVGWGTPGAVTDLGVSLDAGPHVYGVYFDANVVRFYIDHKMTLQYTAAQAAASDRSWPFSKTQYLILNVALSNGTPDSTVLPRSMTVGPIGMYNGVPF